MVFAFAPRSLHLHCFAWAIALLLALTSARPCAAQVVDLRPAPPASGHQQVRVVLEVEGKLKLNPDGKEVQHVPMKATAELQYVERTLHAAKGTTNLRAARYYQKAEAKIKLRETDLTNALRDDRRLIVLDGEQPRPMLFSPLGPLTREELELIEAPASGVSLAALMPARPLKIGSSWEITSVAIERLLGLEAVNKHEVAAKLESVEKEVAIASLEGTVAGAVGGVSSDIELKGKLNFDLRKRTVTWLALAIKENRAIGHAQPGFEIMTTLRMVAAPCNAAAEVGDKALTGLTTTADSGQALIELTVDKAGFQLAHDRRWRVMIERHDATILRLVDRGDLIAQCNISPLPAFTKGEELTLEGFQNDVKQALGKNVGEIVEAAQEAGEDGIAIQRVAVSGTAGELPIQWTYYHLSDEIGRRASLVFTIEGSLVERFAQIDRELISGFRFVEGKQPTPALNSPAGSAAKPMDSKAKR